MNALLFCQAKEGRLPDSCVQRSQKTVRDGGVDAIVDRPIPGEHDPTGRFAVPTCWQFKASPAGNIKPKRGKGGQQAALRQEITKPDASRLITLGYGYRFCIADDMSGPTKARWEGWLLEEAKKINPVAPVPLVLTASDLALWAGRFKSLVVDHFCAELGEFSSLEMWLKEIAGFTPEYVPIAGWSDASRAIRDHVDFGRRLATVLTVHGEAGVGKTRCACESLRNDPAHAALVVYSNEEQKALEFARVIARDSRAKAILVADECSVQVQDQLHRLLPACADCLRVIAIDNSLERDGGGAELRLTRISISDVETILERNFPGLPSDRRRSHAQLTQGFVRLAVDLCQHSNLVPPDGSVESMSGFFHRSYLRTRLRPEELDAVLIVSLLPRVGFREDLAGQLESLCNHSMIARRPIDVVEIAQRLRQSPGFIAFGGRYLYVTPMLIARVAFQSAWERWIQVAPTRFLTEFPANLVDAFVDRVQSSGTPAIRTMVLDFFLAWARNLGPPDLGDECSVVRLVRLIEVQPETLVSFLRELLERTPLDELRRLHSGYEPGTARRELVWLAEKLAYFGEYFNHAEEILFRLAQAETEPHLGNNATRVWTSLFRIALSGTEVTFGERLRLLERRLEPVDSAQLGLVLGALDEILADGPVARLVHPPVVFGRIPPPQWRPADLDEWRECRNLALAMAGRMIAAGGPVADGLRVTLINRLAPLLLGGHVEETRAALGSAVLPDNLLAAVARAIEQFLDVFCKGHVASIHRATDQLNGAGTIDAQPQPATGHLALKSRSDLEVRVRDWYQSIVPSDLHGRLVRIVGQDYWHKQLRGDSAAWQNAMKELSEELLHSPVAFRRELSWLCSAEARSAVHLGQAIAEIDGDGICLDSMLDEIPLAGGVAFARGYVERLATAHPQHVGRVNALLDRLQAEHPRVAYDILWSAGDEVHKVARILQMVDTGGSSEEHDFLRTLAASQALWAH